MVTDLDAHLVERALVSLSAELTRREHILAAAGAKDIEDYTSSQARAGASRLEPLPRLLIVIDEFASMVRDLPDFVTGLVNIAQRGRSLGIHLILATQRPVRRGLAGHPGQHQPADRAAGHRRRPSSADVIDAPDAAHISQSTPGRGYVRLGHASLVPFQAGPGRRPPARHRRGAGERPWLARVDWAGAGRPEPQRPSPRDQETKRSPTSRCWSRRSGPRPASCGSGAQHSPWLPALPGDAAAG